MQLCACMYAFSAGMAQLAAHLICNQQAAGSSPASSLMPIVLATCQNCWRSSILSPDIYIGKPERRLTLERQRCGNAERRMALDRQKLLRQDSADLSAVRTAAKLI